MTAVERMARIPMRTPEQREADRQRLSAEVQKARESLERQERLRRSH